MGFFWDVSEIQVSIFSSKLLETSEVCFSSSSVLNPGDADEDFGNESHSD